MNRKEKILQKLNPKFLKITPKLSGDAGSFIDLDSSDSLKEGAKQLMIRFFRNQDLCEKSKRSSGQHETEVTISSAEYNENHEICEIKSERLTLSFAKTDDDDVSHKPGRRLQKLKMELQEKMSAKWEKEYKKRVSENKIHSQSNFKKGKCSDDDEEDEDESNFETKAAEEYINKLDEDETYDEGDDADVEYDDDDSDGDDGEDVEKKDDEKKNCDRVSVFNDEESNCGSNRDNLEKDDEYENCSLVPAYQPGGGMLYGGSELTQCDEELPQNLISPSLRFSENELSGSKLSIQSSDLTPKKSQQFLNKETDDSFTVKTKLFSQNPNNSFDLNDAFEFCSGKFPDECSESKLISQSVQMKNSDASEEEEAEGCTDEFQSTGEEELGENADLKNFESEKEISKSRKNIIAFEDSEEEEEKNDVTDNQFDEPQSGILKLLSDDEDETPDNDWKIKRKNRKSLHFSDEEDAEGEEDKELYNSEKEEEEEYDFDQRSIQYDSEENEIINPKEFFEKEAELSGSEWSGDEDERGLDRFDVEEGDADNIDSDKVRSELEKIHIRRVLDDDAREVRLIQEILFEDGDLHSDGKRRDRKFKWKNLGAFDEQGNEMCLKDDGGNSSEEDGAEEENLRKTRLEKELFLMGKKKNGDLNSDDEITEDFQAVKVNMVRPFNKPSASENSKIILHRTEIAKTISLFNARGSFLTRNEEFLSRLARATSGFTDNILGPKNSKNFVFATKSPEKTNSEKSTASKRQVESTENCKKREKKIKLQPLEIDTGPSILDLLV